VNLVSTSFFSALAVLTKLATSLFLNKVLAVYVGPAGYGVIGQLQSLITLVTTFASGAVNTGVTKYTAEFAKSPARQRALWTTAATMGLIGAAVLAGLLLLARDPLSRWLLDGPQHSAVLIWLAFALPLLVLNGLMLAIMNGRKAVRALVAANIVGSLISACVAGSLVMFGGLSGALIALAISQAIACGFTAWLFQRACSVRWRELLGRLDLTIAKLLGGFALMAGTSAIVSPLSQMIIRDRFAAHLGWDTTGLWQALGKVSETHLLLLTSTLSVYFLPRFSEIQDGAELRREVFKGYFFVLPVVLTSAAGLYLFRHQLVLTLLSEQFMPLTDVLGIQLIGDVFKIGSWVMAFTMVSHAQTRVFVVTEIAFASFLVLTTLTLGERFGLRGAASAYALTYALYWLAMTWVFGRLISRLKVDGGLAHDAGKREETLPA
jgi:PST family polysaccharide transporter